MKLQFINPETKKIMYAVLLPGTNFCDWKSCENWEFYYYKGAYCKEFKKCLVKIGKKNWLANQICQKMQENIK